MIINWKGSWSLNKKKYPRLRINWTNSFDCENRHIKGLISSFGGMYIKVILNTRRLILLEETIYKLLPASDGMYVICNVNHFIYDFLFLRWYRWESLLREISSPAVFIGLGFYLINPVKASFNKYSLFRSNSDTQSFSGTENACTSFI